MPAQAGIPFVFTFLLLVPVFEIQNQFFSKLLENGPDAIDQKHSIPHVFAPSGVLASQVTSKTVHWTVLSNAVRSSRYRVHQQKSPLNDATTLRYAQP